MRPQDDPLAGRDVGSWIPKKHRSAGSSASAVGPRRTETETAIGTVPHFRGIEQDQGAYLNPAERVGADTLDHGAG
jgi:hypothetical protein